MRELLFLAHRIPYPADKGDKIRSYHILKHLSSNFHIRLGCFADEPVGPDDLGQLKNLCVEVFCLPLSRTKKVVRAARALATGISVSEGSYRDERMARWVAKNVRSGIEDVFVFCSSMFSYVEEYARELRIIADLVDVDSQKWAAYAREAHWPLRQVYCREQEKLFELETRAAKSCATTLFVSPAEASLFKKLAPDAASDIRYLENGVDLERFDCALDFANPFPKTSMPVVFIGVMDYRPNVDAVVWFAREAMPAIRRAHNSAEFWIVGKNPAASVRELGRQPGVRVAGAVCDVRPYLVKACCVVAPLRIARGVQNKVLEAMAMAKPVVLTPAALEGVSAIPGKEVLLGSTAAELSQLVESVLAGNWRDLGQAARRRVEIDYRWDRNLRVLDELLAAMPATSRARGDFLQVAE